MGTATRTKTRRKRTLITFSRRVKAPSAIISLFAVSESVQSGGGTEDDSVGPVTPSAAPTMSSSTISRNPPSSTFCARSHRTRRTSTTKSGSTRRRYPQRRSSPLPIAKTKSSNSAKSRNRKEAHVHMPFPSSVAEGTKDVRPRRVPHMSAVRGRDGGHMKSGGVTGMIAPELGPAEPDDPTTLTSSSPLPLRYVRTISPFSFL